MKTKLFFLFNLLILGMTLHAQQGINYKSVIANNGTVLQNQSISLKFSILENGTTLVYEETHSKTTDANGIVIANIGEGTPSLSAFSTINWSLPQSLKVEVNAGGGFIDMGTTALKYVPYAKMAAKALDANDHDFYKTGTALKATSNSDDIYHIGSLGIGSITYNSQLQVSTDNKLTSAAISNTTVSNIATTGLRTELTGVGTGSHIGTENDLLGEGEGIQYGTLNWISNNGGALHFGVRNTLYGNGSGRHTGTYNELMGNGLGEQMGSYQNIYNANSTTHYGIFSELSGSGNGEHYGVKNVLSGAGNGTNYGTYNILLSTGIGMQMGSVQSISANGNGDHYGFYAYLPGTGSGTKYGVYSLIPSNAGGYHIAIYANATKTGSWAGYFVGNTYFEGKLTSTVSGNADMKAYMYGNVNASGAVSNGCSAGFSVNKQATGTYRITFNAPLSASAYVITGNVLNTSSPRILTYAPSDNYVDVFVWNLSGTLVDEFFNFVIFRK